MVKGASQHVRKPWRWPLRLAAALTVLWLMLRWFEYRQVYHPTRTFDASPEQLARPFEEVRFEASDGVALHGWFFPAETSPSRGRFAFLICHGNGGNVSHRLDLCEALLRCGASVLVFDYRGYGRSGGRPDEEGTYRDAQAAYAWLRHRGFEPAQILAYGESMGGPVAAELALREKVGGLVIQSAFTSIADIGVELFPWLPVRWLHTLRYDTREKLARVTVPVLVLHSRQDELVGFHHAERNFAAVRGPKLFHELRGGHNDALADVPNFLAGIEKFLAMIHPADAVERRK